VAYPGVADLKSPSRLGNDLPHATRTRSQTVLFVGSIFNRRHVPELIEGFARLARVRGDARLQIVGDNRTSPPIDVADAIRATGLTDRIQLRSYVTDQELQALYAGASAFAFLSEYEGFGLTPLEAMAAGLPVLLLDTPVAREICGEAAIYVERPDPALIEDALATLLFDSGERRRLVDAADRVLAKYSWTECARQVLKVLIASGRG
jgi:glycosyltransferase involved in cell wall biosynthesis